MVLTKWRSRRSGLLGMLPPPPLLLLPLQHPLSPRALPRLGLRSKLSAPPGRLLPLLLPPLLPRRISNIRNSKNKNFYSSNKSNGANYRSTSCANSRLSGRDNNKIC